MSSLYIFHITSLKHHMPHIGQFSGIQFRLLVDRLTTGLSSKQISKQSWTQPKGLWPICSIRVPFNIWQMRLPKTQSWRPSTSRYSLSTGPRSKPARAAIVGFQEIWTSPLMTQQNSQLVFQVRLVQKQQRINNRNQKVPSRKSNGL